MKHLAVILLGCFTITTALAQTTATSRSGQFTVASVGSDMVRPFVPAVATNAALFKLEPALLAISCERIKQALLSTLAANDQWRGKVRLILHPTREPNEEITVSAMRFTDGWNYEVALPDMIEPDRLVRVITQVLLVEIANRQNPAQSAILPTWLAEGMPRYLDASTDIGFVVQPALPGNVNLPAVRHQMLEGRPANAFIQARNHLRQREPLTLRQLSYPNAEQLAGLDGEAYRDTALLFINELLQFKTGGACLFALLPELPWDPDWRVAFLKAFKPYFKRELDFEKWWALQSAYFAGRDSHQTWPRAESLVKLDQVLRTPLEVRLGSNEPALYTDVPLQAVIKGWKMDRQTPVLREKIALLQNLLVRVAPELRPTVQQYRDVLTAYLGKMDGIAPHEKFATNGRNRITSTRAKDTSAPAPNNPVLKETLAQLDILDERCAAWKVMRDPSSEMAR